MGDPLRHAAVAQLGGSPGRHYYRGRDLARAVAVADLRTITHRRMPRLFLEYLEGGAAGAQRALQILHQEALDAMGLLGVASVRELGPGCLRAARDPGRCEA